MSDDEGSGFDRLGVPRALFDATRALLWVASAADASNVASDLVRALGGEVVSADDVEGETLPIDLSFGVGSPLLPSAPRTSAAAAQLRRYLPAFVLDARRALEVNSEVHRFSVEAAVDSLTQLPNRRMVARALGRLRAGDTVIMIDLDHFKRINDTYGHAAGDTTLRTLGRTLRAITRGRDFVGRYGGEEFIVVLSDTSDPEAFLGRLRAAWTTARPYDISFSAGIAVAGDEPSAAIAAADRAMYRAKSEGRDRWSWSAGNMLDGPRPVDGHQPPKSASFVAFSRIHVPAEGSVDLERAFADRLGAVDHWPGFLNLEVWEDIADPTSFAMISWWTSPDAFRAYMQSSDHRLSHSRISKDDLRPRARQFRRYRVIAR